MALETGREVESGRPREGAGETHRPAAPPAVEAVPVHGHAHSDAALLSGARLAQALDLAVVVDAVELEHRQRDRLVDVLHLLGFGVGLLLTLLTTTAKAEHLIAKRKRASGGGWGGEG